MVENTGKRKRPPGERRTDTLARNIALGVLAEMEKQMGVNFVTHTSDHSWIGTKRQAEAEAEELRRKESSEHKALRNEIKRTIILRLLIPGLGLAFLTAIFGRDIAAKLFGFLAGG